MMSLQKQIIWIGRLQWTLAALIALSAGVFYFVAYRPQTQKLASLRGEAETRRQELYASRNQTSILPSVSQEVERLRSKLRRFKAIPRQQELSQFIIDIAHLGQQSALKKFDLKPGLPTRDHKFNELPVQLTFEGDFVNVYSFLRHTEDLQRLTRVRGMDIRGRDRLGQVKVQLTMNIYFAAE